MTSKLPKFPNDITIPFHYIKCSTVIVGSKNGYLQPYLHLLPLRNENKSQISGITTN